MHYCEQHVEHEREYLASRQKWARSHTAAYQHKYNTRTRSGMVKPVAATTSTGHGSGARYDNVCWNVTIIYASIVCCMVW